MLIGRDAADLSPRASSTHNPVGKGTVAPFATAPDRTRPHRTVPCREDWPTPDGRLLTEWSDPLALLAALPTWPQRWRLEDRYDPKQVLVKRRDRVGRQSMRRRVQQAFGHPQGPRGWCRPAASIDPASRPPPRRCMDVVRTRPWPVGSCARAQSCGHAEPGRNAHPDAIHTPAAHWQHRPRSLPHPRPWAM